MNIFEKIVTDIGRAVIWPFTHAAKVIKVLETALRDEPVVKTAVVGLIQKIETLGVDATQALAAKGLNFSEDDLTAHAAQALFAYVKGEFLPAIEGAYKDAAALLSDPQLDPQPVALEVDASTIVKLGPGLHTVAITA